MALLEEELSLRVGSVSPSPPSAAFRSLGSSQLLSSILLPVCHHAETATADLGKMSLHRENVGSLDAQVWLR